MNESSLWGRMSEFAQQTGKKLKEANPFSEKKTAEEAIRQAGVRILEKQEEIKKLNSKIRTIEQNVDATIGKDMNFTGGYSSSTPDRADINLFKYGIERLEKEIEQLKDQQKTLASQYGIYLSPSPSSQAEQKGANN